MLSTLLHMLSLLAVKCLDLFVYSLRWVLEEYHKRLFSAYLVIDNKRFNPA